jgi:hypothetical protein
MIVFFPSLLIFRNIHAVDFLRPGFPFSELIRYLQIAHRGEMIPPKVALGPKQEQERASAVRLPVTKGHDSPFGGNFLRHTPLVPIPLRFLPDWFRCLLRAKIYMNATQFHRFIQL